MLDILRSTLEQVNRDPELRPDDPKVIEAKRSLEQSIEELENFKSYGELKRAA